MSVICPFKGEKNGIGIFFSHEIMSICCSGNWTSRTDEANLFRIRAFFLDFTFTHAERGVVLRQS